MRTTRRSAWMHLEWYTKVVDTPFGWKIFETKRTVGACWGYRSVNARVSLNIPSSQMVPSGPKIIAFHFIILFGSGEAFTPMGGSALIARKSRTSLCKDNGCLELLLRWLCQGASFIALKEPRAPTPSNATDYL